MLDSKLVVAALERGFTVTQIAQSMNVTPSAVTQYIEAHQLQEMVQKNERYDNIDSKYDKIELKLLEKMESMVNSIVPIPAAQLNSFIRTINGAKRRSMSEGRSLTNTTDVKIVNIRLPEHVKVKAQLNHNSEVVEIAGQVVNTIANARIGELAKEVSDAPQLSQVL